jgi:hypothetical protein
MEKQREVVVLGGHAAEVESTVNRVLILRALQTAASSWTAGAWRHMLREFATPHERAAFGSITRKRKNHAVSIIAIDP